jgi:hypothetical protein
MATQTLEFNATSGLTITAKLFALESDTVVASAVATEKTNDKGRYTVAYTDVPAGDYRMNGFIGAAGGFVNENYSLTLTTDTFLPWSEAFTTAMGAKIMLIGSGSSTVSAPVAATGDITTPIVIGDDYLAANAREFSWLISAIPGFTIGACTCYFAGYDVNLGSWSVTGTLEVSGINWLLKFDLPKTATDGCLPGIYDWNVAVHSAGVEVTRVRSSSRKALLVNKYTP